MARIDSASCLGGGAPALRSGRERTVHAGATCANADTNADTNVDAHADAYAYADTTAAGFAAVR